MKILKETNQPLLLRTKYEINLIHDKAKTPSKEEIKDKIASLIKKEKELVIIDKILTLMGSSQSTVIAYAYENQKALEASKPKKNAKKKNKKQKSK